MLRFRPDDWLEGLLRPFVMLDPQGFVHIEFPAPDLRFAALALLSVAFVLIPGLRARLQSPAWRTLLALWLAFYVWTFVIGNGRYFIVGMLVVGPLLVLLLGALPLTRQMRLLTLAGLLGLQAILVHQHFNHSMWGMAFWRDGPGVGLDDSPLRKHPATFVTISSISHSILVPQFHPRSHWVNLIGQVDVVPGLPEHDRAQKLLAADLPRYLVMHRFVRGADDSQPEGEMAEMIERSLSRHGLRRDGRPCETLRTNLLTTDPSSRDEGTSLAYWVCPLRRDEAPAPADDPADGHWDDIFTAVEQHCPRFFPPNGGEHRMLGQVAMRHYPGSDTRLYVDPGGRVTYRYLRSLNPTFIGDAEQIRRGEFAVDCHKLPGRYAYPWQRD